MEPRFWITLFFGCVAGVATLLGTCLIFWKEEWTRRNSIFFVSFSGGAVLTVAFTHLLPEALEFRANSVSVVLFTLIAFYILEHTIAIHTCQEGECAVHHMGIPAFVGISLHSLIDGVVIGVGFEAGFHIGLAATLGVLLHEIPEGMSITSILLHSGFKRKGASLMSWVVAVATPVGALGSYIFIRGAGEAVLGVLLAFAAGSFIYVGAADLLPETHKKTSRANIPLVLAGVVLVYTTFYLVGR